MARVEGIDPQQTSFLMRQVFKKVRKILGRDLTPQKIAARVSRVFWINALAEWLLGQIAAVPQRQRMVLTLRTATRVGRPFLIIAKSPGGRITGRSDGEMTA